MTKLEKISLGIEEYPGDKKLYFDEHPEIRQMLLDMLNVLEKEE